MEKEPVCGVCLASFVQPKVLPCGHSFCTACILQCVRHNKKRVFLCPVCKKNLGTVTDTEVDKFPRNFDLEKLVQLIVKDNPVKRLDATTSTSIQQVPSKSSEVATTSMERLQPHRCTRQSCRNEQHTCRSYSRREREEEELRIAMQASLAESGSGFSGKDDEELARVLYISEMEASKNQTEVTASTSTQQHQGINLRIKGLPGSVSDADLFHHFSRFGRITSSKVMTSGDGRSKGYGFVCYESHASAKRAMREMNGQILAGGRMRLNVARVHSHKST